MYFKYKTGSCFLVNEQICAYFRLSETNLVNRYKK